MKDCNFFQFHGSYSKMLEMKTLIILAIRAMKTMVLSEETCCTCSCQSSRGLDLEGHWMKPRLGMYFP